MFVWGRNNNHLFRQNHKKTYSLPQKLPVNRSVLKCAPGYDYILLLQKSPGPLVCYYQSAFYQISHFASNVVDVSTTDNIIVVITADGSAWIMEFNAEKIIDGELNPAKINIKQKSSALYMNYGDIFLQTESQSIYYLKRNEWYETKTYTDPVKIQGLKQQKIKQIAPGLNQNYFLTHQGSLYISSKKEADLVVAAQKQVLFKSIAAADYFVGVAQNGRLYVWGKYNQRNYQKPTQFGKLAQPFKSIHLSIQNGYAITQNGQGWIWGKNANGQLGISDYQPRAKPFPLITMEKYKIKDIFLGQSFTVCTVENEQKQAAKLKKQKNLVVQESQIKPKRQQNNSQQSLNQTAPLEKSKSNIKIKKQGRSEVNKSLTKNKISVNVQSSSLNIREKQKSEKAKDEKMKFVATEVVRKSPYKVNKPKANQNKFQSTVNKSQKSLDKFMKRSKSPMSNLSRSKSPVSAKSPYAEKIRPREFQNANKQKQNLKNQSPSKISQYKHKIALLETSNSQLMKSLQNIKNLSVQQIRGLQEQNKKLKKIVGLKQIIIEDVTQKIKLLEDAIEQHQRTLTARDNMMEEYQKREKEYQIHIDQLQKNIEMLIQGQSTFQPRQEECYNQMYKALKLEYFKQKDYFMQKMTEYEQVLKDQRLHQKEQIRNLQEEINTYRTSQRQYGQQQSSRFKENSILAERKSEVLNRENSRSMNPIDQTGIKMNFIISRIEDSKLRIAKSATKLYQMIDN